MRVRLLLLSIAVAILVAACSSQRRTPDANRSTDLPTTGLPPFSTKEPERYQATRIIRTTTADGITSESKLLIVRDGPSRSEEYVELNLPSIRYLYLPQGNFVVGPAEKIFSEVVPGTTPAGEEQTESVADHLIETETGTSSFQQLGTESVNGRSATKFRIVVNNSSSGTVTSNETLLWIDQSLGIPIKSESRSPKGTVEIMELSDIRLDIDFTTLKLPDGFQKVDFVELMRRLRR